MVHYIMKLFAWDLNHRRAKYITRLTNLFLRMARVSYSTKLRMC